LGWGCPDLATENASAPSIPTPYPSPEGEGLGVVPAPLLGLQVGRSFDKFGASDNSTEQEMR